MHRSCTGLIVISSILKHVNFPSVHWYHLLHEHTGQHRGAPSARCLRGHLARRSLPHLLDRTHRVGDDGEEDMARAHTLLGLLAQEKRRSGTGRGQGRGHRAVGFGVNLLNGVVDEVVE